MTAKWLSSRFSLSHVSYLPSIRRPNPVIVGGLHHPMGNSGFSYSELRDRCDEYMDPSKYVCGGGYTMFHVDHVHYIRDNAEAALNFYNKKKRENFILDKVVKVNFVGGMHYFMTFWAQRDKSDERHLFRGVYGRGNVLLCEIKDGDWEITIPAGHEEGEEEEPEDEADTFEITRDDWEWIQKAPNVCDLSSEDEDEDDKEDEKC